MKIKHYEKDFPYVIIENTYSNDELDLIWEELSFLCHQQKFMDGEEYKNNSAIDDGRVLKKNNCLWIDSFYSKREYSNILNINRKIFNYYDEIFGKHSSWIFNNFNCNSDSTLLSYYENQDYYDYHKDSAYITCLTWFYREPRMFSGGDLLLKTNRNQVTIKIKNNYTLLFPSMIHHKVSEINMNEFFCNKKLGRFCMTQFLHY